MTSQTVLPFSASISDPQLLAELLAADPTALRTVHDRYPLRISGYYLNLIRTAGAPLWRQAVPDLRELDDPDGLADPLHEERLSPVPNLVHKYPDRALFLVSDICAVHCRFCTRKRRIGRPETPVTDDTIRAGLDYLVKTPAISDVLLSGGDPLMLPLARLEHIVKAVRAIPSVATIRIGTRVPCTLPQRVTPRLANMLKHHHPLYINTHFNHPAELTAEARLACNRLADAGIPLGCQTVLLRGVNDSADILRQLFTGLLAMRVRPYALYQADLTRGTCHFRTTIAAGQDLMRQLIGRLSGIAVPTYGLDTPGGGGKIPLTPAYLTRLGRTAEFVTWKGHPGAYPNTVLP